MNNNIYVTEFNLLNQVNNFEEAKAFLLEDNMAQYLDEPLSDKIQTINWLLTEEDEGYVVIESIEPLSSSDKQLLSDWIRGQNSDGLGESFEQQPFAESEYEPYMCSFDWDSNPYIIKTLEDIDSHDKELILKFLFDFNEDAIGVKDTQGTPKLKDLLENAKDFNQQLQQLYKRIDKNEQSIIEELWGAACSGNKDFLEKYYNTVGIPNLRYEKFGETHSLIMGAFRNGHLELAEFLMSQEETLTPTEEKELTMLLNQQETARKLLKKEEEKSIEIYLVIIESTYYGENATCCKTFSTRSKARQYFNQIVEETKAEDHLMEKEHLMRQNKDYFYLHEKDNYAEDHIKIYITSAIMDEV